MVSATRSAMRTPGALDYEAGCVAFSPNEPGEITVASSDGNITVASSEGRLEVTRTGDLSSTHNQLSDRCAGATAEMLLALAGRAPEQPLASDLRTLSSTLMQRIPIGRISFARRNTVELSDGRLAVSDGRRLYAFDVAKRKLEMLGRVPLSASHLVLTPDGKTGYFVGGSGNIEEFDVKTGARRVLIPSGWPKHVTGLQVHDDQLVVTHHDGMSVYRRADGSYRGGVSEGDEYYPEAEIGSGDRESSRHHIYLPGTNSGMLFLYRDNVLSLDGPFVLSPDQSKVFMGSGEVYDRDSHRVMANIGLRFDDLVFKDDEIVLSQADTSGTTRIVVLDKNTYKLKRQHRFAGHHQRLHVAHGKVYLLEKRDGVLVTHVVR